MKRYGSFIFWGDFLNSIIYQAHNRCNGKNHIRLSESGFSELNVMLQSFFWTFFKFNQLPSAQPMQ